MPLSEPCASVYFFLSHVSHMSHALKQLGPAHLSPPGNAAIKLPAYASGAHLLFKVTSADLLIGYYVCRVMTRL